MSDKLIAVNGDPVLVTTKPATVTQLLTKTADLMLLRSGGVQQLLESTSADRQQTNGQQQQPQNQQGSAVPERVSDDAPSNQQATSTSTSSGVSSSNTSSTSADQPPSQLAAQAAASSSGSSLSADPGSNAVQTQPGKSQVSRLQYALNDQYISVHLVPAPVEFKPVQYAVVEAPGGSGDRLGYIRIAVFSQNAPGEFEEALKDLKVRRWCGREGVLLS